MKHYITINSKGEELSAVLQYPSRLAAGGAYEDEPSKYPIVIICHGFVGNKIGTDRLFAEVSDLLTAGGYMVLRFDYGGCGESTGDYGSGGLDVLIEQTRTVIDYAADLDCVDQESICLLGHSLGGATAVCTAARDTRVKSLVLWAPVANPYGDLKNIVGKQIWEEIELKGSADYMHYQFTRRYVRSLQEFHPLEELHKFQGHVFVVHGTADDVVPVDYCFLYQRMFWLRRQGICDKEVILGADHTFSSKQARDQLFEKTGEWLDSMRRKRKDWSDYTI